MCDDLNVDVSVVIVVAVVAVGGCRNEESERESHRDREIEREREKGGGFVEEMNCAPISFTVFGVFLTFKITHTNPTAQETNTLCAASGQRECAALQSR